MVALLDGNTVVEKKKRRYVVAKVDVEAVVIAKKVAALRGLTLADYISEVLLPVAMRDLQIEAKKISRKEKPPER